MGIRFLSRTDCCALAGLDVEQYKVLRRRDQVPMVPNPDLPEEVANARGYEARSALYLIIANELAERYEISRDYAAKMAAHAICMHDRWKEISATSAQLAAGKEPTHDILFALIDWWGFGQSKTKRRDTKAAVGTLAEIAHQHPGARDIIATSLTRCAALMRQRAAKARINLDEFWKT
jgi:hypothetical protein